MLQRLKDLKEEFRRGEEQLVMLDRKRGEVRDVLLRISGAIQVLEEFTAGDPRQQMAAGD